MVWEDLPEGGVHERATGIWIKCGQLKAMVEGPTVKGTEKEEHGVFTGRANAVARNLEFP